MNRPPDITPSAAARTFRDRRDAGRVLAGALTGYRGRPGLLVLGLARGGVPVGREVATALHAPLEVFLVRKLGVPHWPELAMGALTGGGPVVMNDQVLADLQIGDEAVRAVIDRETAELRRRERLYRGARPAVPLTGRVALLVDDGIATGATMLAAVRAVQAGGAAEIVVAVPVGPASVCRTIGQEVDAVVCVSTPVPFDAVGQAYRDFRQVDDDDVRRLLAG